MQCPLLNGTQSFTLASNKDTHGHRCQGLRKDTPFLYGLSLRNGARVQGAVILAYHQEPHPASRYLGSLSVLIETTKEVLRRKCGDVFACAGGTNMVTADRSGDELKIRCFGRFELSIGGRSLPRFRRTQAFTLLKLLIYRQGLPISRDALCEKLWPGVETAKSSKRLHVVIHALRKGLESHQHRIRSGQDQYHFDLSGNIEVDLVKFLDLTTQGRDIESNANPEEVLNFLERAIELYRGDLFADEPPAEWLRAGREHLKETFLSALKKSASLWVEVGDLCRAIANLKLALNVDPSREDFHQNLMEYYWRGGRQQEALAHYEICASLLLRELRVEPIGFGPK